MVVVEDWFLGAELNRIRLEVREGTAAVGQAWFDLITRVTIQVHGVTVDSDIESNVFDWTTEKADSILRLELGRSATVAGDFTSTPLVNATYPARVDIYHGTDNAVISSAGTESHLRLRIM